MAQIIPFPTAKSPQICDMVSDDVAFTIMRNYIKKRGFYEFVCAIKGYSPHDQQVALDAAFEANAITGDQYRAAETLLSLDAFYTA